MSRHFSDDGGVTGTWVLQAVSTLGAGGAIGAFATYIAGKRQAETAQANAALNARTQIEVADRQHQAQRVIEEDKFRRQMTAEGYKHLMLWLDDIKSTIDEIWDHICTSGPDHQQAAAKLLDDWPWKTLHPSRDAASVRHYWSDSVNNLIADIAESSSKFCNAGRVANSHRESNSEDLTIRRQAQSDVWENRDTMLKTMNHIYRITRNELLGREIALHSR